jgi:hypothetical protein
MPAEHIRKKSSPLNVIHEDAINEGRPSAGGGGGGAGLKSRI